MSKQTVYLLVYVLATYILPNIEPAPNIENTVCYTKLTVKTKTYSNED